jgi:hypothetical protein
VFAKSREHCLSPLCLRLTYYWLVESVLVYTYSRKQVSDAIERRQKTPAATVGWDGYKKASRLAMNGNVLSPNWSSPNTIRRSSCPCWMVFVEALEKSFQLRTVWERELEDAPKYG